MKLKVPKLSEKWSFIQALIFILLIIPIIWGATYLSEQIITIPNEYYKIFWKLFWIIFVVNLVKIRGGNGWAMLGYGLLAWLTGGISFLLLPLVFWLLVKYKKGVIIFSAKKKNSQNIVSQDME